MLILGVSGSDLLYELRSVSLELCVVAADAAVCTLLWSMVGACERAVQRISSAPVFEVNANLLQKVREAAAAGGSKNSSTPALDFVGVRGVVSPSAGAIYSQWRPEVAGVMRRQAVSEHSISWSSSGFWSERTRVLRDSVASVPFILAPAGENPGWGVSVDSVQQLSHVDMLTVHDQYVPTPQSSLAVAVWQWMVGERQHGLRDVEQMLVSGTRVTGFGRLQLSADGRELMLTPPPSGGPFVITEQSQQALTERMLDDHRPVKWVAVVLSLAGCAYSVWLMWRVWRGLRLKRTRRSLLLQWDDIRAERRRRERDTGPVPEPVQCVVCLANPREVVLSPCQHVCLCVDCEEQLVQRVCPVCRQQVVNVRPAYIS